MAKIDLKKSSGFPLQSESGILTSPDLSFSKTRAFSIYDLRPQLLNQDLSYPQEVYTKYYSFDQDDVFRSKGFVVNVYQIPPNLAGIEYVKTRAIRSNLNRIFEMWYGGGTVLLQNYVQENNDVLVLKLKREQKFIVPAGYAVSLVNTRQAQLVVAEVQSVDSRNKAVLDEMKGMAYYVIRKNAKQEIVRNPFYKHAPEFRKYSWDSKLSKYGVTLKTPVIKQILRKHEKFNWLFGDNEIEL